MPQLGAKTHIFSTRTQKSGLESKDKGVQFGPTEAAALCAPPAATTRPGARNLGRGKKRGEVVPAMHLASRDAPRGRAGLQPRCLNW